MVLLVSTLYYAIFMIFMIVFEALTNGTQGAVRFVIGLECLLYFLDANVAALQRSMRVLAGAGFVAVSAGVGF